MILSTAIAIVLASKIEKSYLATVLSCPEQPLKLNGILFSTLQLYRIRYFQLLSSLQIFFE